MRKDNLFAGVSISKSVIEANQMWKLHLMLAAIVLAAFGPAFNNGFISDDYLFLERISILKHDLLYLFAIPPENFRTTTYLCFGFLKSVFGYHAPFFYGFTMLVHITNSMLVYKLFFFLSRNQRIAIVGALLFAAFQNPQEAVMWLGGMHEVLLGFFILCTIYLWLTGRHLWSTVFYCVALFTKESAPVVLVLLPLAEAWIQRKFKFRREYFYLAVPTMAFCAIFIYTVGRNSLARDFYAFWPAHALMVLAISFHRLIFPWFYIAALIYILNQGWRIPSSVVAGLAWMVIALSPYIFLTYQNHVPSRHEYLASIGLIWSLAVLLGQLGTTPWRCIFIAGFITINIAYLWLVKDKQFEQRAAPTTQLLSLMRNSQPRRLLIYDFPFYPETAKMSTRLVPGWTPEMLLVNERNARCPDCLQLRWNAKTQAYEVY